MSQRYDADDEGLLVPTGFQLNGPEIDALLYRAEEVEEPDVIYDTVLTQYESADVLSATDEIRLTELRQYLDKNGFESFAGRASRIEDGLYGRDIVVDVGSVQDAFEDGEYIEAVRALGRAGQAASKRVKRFNSRFFQNILELTSEQYDGWTQPR